MRGISDASCSLMFDRLSLCRLLWNHEARWLPGITRYRPKGYLSCNDSMGELNLD